MSYARMPFKGIPFNYPCESHEIITLGGPPAGLNKRELEKRAWHHVAYDGTKRSWTDWTHTYSKTYMTQPMGMKAPIIAYSFDYRFVVTTTTAQQSPVYQWVVPDMRKGTTYVTVNPSLPIRKQLELATQKKKKQPRDLSTPTLEKRDVDDECCPSIPPRKPSIMTVSRPITHTVYAQAQKDYISKYSPFIVTGTTSATITRPQASCGYTLKPRPSATTSVRIMAKPKLTGVKRPLLPKKKKVFYATVTRYLPNPNPKVPANSVVEIFKVTR